jgi:putative transposon-encoded protein
LYDSSAEGYERSLAEMADEMKPKREKTTAPKTGRGKVKLEVYGEEMVEKVVKLSGNSGRVYLPPDWVGCRVKIIRIN